MNRLKLIRITTIPLSLKTLLKGQLRFMTQKGFEVIAVSSENKQLKEVSEEENVRVFSIEMSRKITPINDLFSLWKMYRFLKTEKPMFVHTHTPKAGIVGMLAAKLAGVPHRLHTVAGLPLMEATGIKRKILDFVERLTYWSATNIYPNSKGLYDFILQNNYTKNNKLKVIANGSSNGIDTNFFSPEKVSEENRKKLRLELNLQADDFVFVFVGRLVGDKGINELIAAFSGINNKPAKLLLVGNFEPELDPLDSKTLDAINTNPNIISVGFQKDVRPYFAISDALAFPSYREGFPNVVMQAGAMNLPSIVSNINGCNEIIVDGENGLIVPVKNIEVLQQAMLTLITKNSLWEQLKKNSRTMITSRYEQQVVWNAILDEYNSLLRQ